MEEINEFISEYFFPGILMSEGNKWQSLRSFAIASLKPGDALNAVEAEVKEMISVLKTHLAMKEMPQDSRKVFELS